MTPTNGSGPWRPTPPPYGAAPQPPYQPPVPPALAPTRKEPFLSVVASFFIPGLGTMLNGQAGKGVAFMVAFFFGPPAALMMSFIVFTADLMPDEGIMGLPIPETSSNPILIATALAVGVWIWGLIDAYKGAEAHNARNGLH